MKNTAFVQLVLFAALAILTIGTQLGGAVFGGGGGWW